MQTDMSRSTQVRRSCGGRHNRHGDSRASAAVPSGNQPVGARKRSQKLSERLRFFTLSYMTCIFGGASGESEETCLVERPHTSALWAIVTAVFVSSELIVKE